MVYLGPNQILVADNVSGGSFPIMAYSTRDNASLTYQLEFSPPEISLQNGNVLTVAGGTAVGRYFVDVSSSSAIYHAYNLP